MGVLFFHWSQLFPGVGKWLAQVHYPGHPWVNLALPMAIGWEGVPLFFVLSGYLLTSQWLGRPLAWPRVFDFYLRRALRIYPAFWFQLAVLVAVGYFLPKAFSIPTLRDLLLTGLLWINLPPEFVAPISGVWWTLPVELMFYLCLPLIVLLTRKIGLTWVWLAALGLTFCWRSGVIDRYAGQDLSRQLDILDSLPGALSVFLSGVAMAVLQHRIPPTWRRPMLWLAVSLFLSLHAVLIDQIEVYWKGGVLLVVFNTLLSVSMALAVGAMCTQDAPSLLRGKVMVWLGDLSFGIYLWHYPLIMVLKTYWPDLGKSALESIGILLVLLTGTLMMASLSYYTIERPAMRMGR
jgi:peptidoglycan/LPS O-acetylase OafA/YrhL